MNNYLKLKVFPDSNKNKVVRKDSVSFDVFVKAEAKAGEANDSVIALMAREMGVLHSKLRIIKGRRSRNKTLEIKQ